MMAALSWVAFLPNTLLRRNGTPPAHRNHFKRRATATCDILSMKNQLNNRPRAGSSATVAFLAQLTIAHVPAPIITGRHQSVLRDMKIQRNATT